MRRNSQKWIPFGFDTVSNKIVDIASVENGLSCNCICLICGTSLIAKQGKNQKNKSIGNATFIDQEKLLQWNPDILFIDAGGFEMVK